ncbi:VCBS repeat-containing protein [uncultured Desulfosarcina sp.]|uniref:VCBS repeat-containing protein n=1 Tax=uncultured Desulfosarcina sp. TaxID=218289 RepID=UPI0029C68DAC|nr:VCBS repeat-containing protein [uncultured Desulfosarcina sp.]
MKRDSRWLNGVLRLFIAFFILVHSPALAEETAKRVLILPLTIHSEKDLTFLNRGIMDMMASRIGTAATVIRKDALPPGKDPIQMGRDLNADYVVTGSLTLFGNSASTDAALTAVETGDAALRFNQFGQSSGDVLNHINQFATQAGQYLAAQSAQPQVAAPTAAAPAIMVPQVAPPVQELPQPSPQPVAVPTPAPVAAAPIVATAPPAAQTAAVEKEIEPLWTSNPFKGTISALATGDVDGNGRPDIAFVHESRVMVETRNGDRLDRLAGYDAGKRHTIVALDAGDINGNGKAEVFVTRLDAYNKLDSVVLEYNGSSLQPIAGGQPWYFRVGDDPEKGPILMGQRRGTPSAIDTGGLYESKHFLSGIFELTWTGREYQAGRRLPLSQEMTIYRFARGNIFNDGKTRAIAYSASDELRIYDPAGSPQWAGQETLGGNPMFLASESSTDARTTDRTYLTQRLIPADLDGDGTVEVVTVHNRDFARGFVERFRQYTRGRVIALRWNKVNMKEIWTGEEISGYISDFSLADLNGDGRLEAVYAMVTSTGIMQTKSSNIVVEQIGELSDK